MSEYQTDYQGYQQEFEDFTREYLQRMKTSPSILGESMTYSLLNGGKRIRPVLALACAKALGVDKDDVLPFALAIEMIHTYSLIHDDLPAMDNDDFRRGKPSNHKVFGEANAILAGDGLLNEAYAICFRESLKGEKHLRASLYLNECAGIAGMIAGQSADLSFSGTDGEIAEKDLLYVYAQKTGKLLSAPIVMMAILKNDGNYSKWERFGQLLGVLFQMTDDILDVTGDFNILGKSIGKDQGQNKLTCVRLYGLEESKRKAELCAQHCHDVLKEIDADTAFLHTLIDGLLLREK